MTNASMEELKSAYFYKAKQLHPDLNPDPSAHKQFNRVQDAFNILSNVEERNKYDNKFQ
jgi:molecular chaperone DnaJ